MGKELKEINRIVLDFDALEFWRDPDQDDIPICSLLALYRAAGLVSELKDYAASNPGMQFCGLDNLSCNFYTLQHMRRFITDNWRRFSLKLTGDRAIEWDTHRYAKGTAHRLFNLKTKIQNSINFDFANFCPSVDDELPDDTIVFSVPIEASETEESSEND